LLTDGVGNLLISIKRQPPAVAHNEAVVDEAMKNAIMAAHRIKQQKMIAQLGQFFGAG